MVKLVRCCWSLLLKYLNSRQTFITFDLFDDDSELAIGLNYKALSCTDLLSTPPNLTLNRPNDKVPRVLPVYLDKVDPYKARLLLDVTKLPRLTRALAALPFMLCSNSLAKRIPRYTHAPASEARRILALPGYKCPKLHDAIDSPSGQCPFSTASEQPLPSKKASLSHVKQHFNQHLQADFVWVEIRNTKYVVLHAVDGGTGLSENLIVPARCARFMSDGLEEMWINRHGAPASFVSDFEFDTKHMNSFLALHSIKNQPRPVRRHDKTGIVERQHRTLKVIFKRIQTEKTSSFDTTLLS